MRVAREFKKDFGDRFKADIEKPPTSATAGLMARFLLGMKLSKANYTGRATQERLLIKYLRRALVIKWDSSDLLAACKFLREFPRERALAVQFSREGQDHFPRIPHFPLWSGLHEVGLGPYDCDQSGALENFQKAIDLHEQGEITLSDSELEQARSAISLVKDHQERMERHQPGSPCYADDEYDDDEWEDDDSAGFRMSIGGSEDEFDPMDVDNIILAALLAAMPPEVKSTLMEMARQMAVSPEEALRVMVESTGELAFSESQLSRPRKE